jgi:hypothetical protein
MLFNSENKAGRNGFVLVTCHPPYTSTEPEFTTATLLATSNLVYPYIHIYMCVLFVFTLPFYGAGFFGSSIDLDIYGGW